MTTRRGRVRSLTARLRAIGEQSDVDDDDATPVRRTRLHTISFDESHRSRVWLPPETSLDPNWYARHGGVEPMPLPPERRSFWAKWFGA